MNKLLIGFIFLILGLVGGYFLQPFVLSQLTLAGIVADDNSKGGSDSSSGEKEILYWVAPMDANYRRDKPGQSPMGMDLVPFYKDDGGEDGIVRISPIVQNNLGVRISSVQKGKLDRKINTVGYISFDEEKLYHIHTRVEGWIDKLVVKATGEVIKKGQKLFELYSPTLVNAQEEYLSALKSKNKILIKASKDRLISLGIHRGQIRQLKKSHKVRQRIPYYAQYNGFIENLKIREGMFVKPAMDILTIGQIDTVWAIAEVFERQSGWVEIGQTVDMQVVAYPDKNWQGIVDYIYPTLDKKTRTLRVRIRFDNPQKQLKPNMFSQLSINSSFDKEILFVNREAIIRSGTMERVVKSLGEGKFLSVAVKTGTESGDYIEIIKGIAENDQIVTSAQFLIDSESNLSASYQRMEVPVAMQNAMNIMAMDETKKNVNSAIDNRAWIKGKVVDIMPKDQKITLQHETVKVWGWPPMLMDFPVIKTMDLTTLRVNMEFNFLVEKHADGSIEIIEINRLQHMPLQTKEM